MWNRQLSGSYQHHQKKENSNLKNTPVEIWLHGSIMRLAINQIKGIESFMLTLPDSIGLVQKEFKAMANETDVSRNCLNLRQN